MKNTCETCRYSSAVKKEILNILICLNAETYRTTLHMKANACDKYEGTYLDVDKSTELYLTTRLPKTK